MAKGVPQIDRFHLSPDALSQVQCKCIAHEPIKTAATTNA